MLVCHSHNLSASGSRGERTFGLKLGLPAGDTLATVLGGDWSAFRWYASETERDAALSEIISKHPYSRPGDRPTYVVERVVRHSDGTVTNQGVDTEARGSG